MVVGKDSKETDTNVLYILGSDNALKKEYTQIFTPAEFV